MTEQRRAAGEVIIRSIDADELELWTRTLDASFLRAVAEGEIDLRRMVFTPGRSLGAFAGSECVATSRTFDLELTVPGGRIVPMEGITNVAVLPAHRRKGLLTGMMRQTLDEAAGRGQALAGLISTEYRIYGRFGFGPSTRTASYEIDVRRAGGVPLPASRPGSVVAATMEDIRTHGPQLYEVLRRTQAGAIDRREVTWQLRTGALRNPIRPSPEPWAVLYRDGEGAPAGMALYRLEEKWRRGDPDYRLSVEELIAPHPAAASALWSHLLATDWVTEVTVTRIGLDDPLPLLLDNPRACTHRRSSGNDHLWLRMLDVPRALRSRRYDQAGSVVLEVHDRLGCTPGRFLLETVADGIAQVTTTDHDADLGLDVAALAQIYLGDRTFHHLAAAGLVTELLPGSIERADRMFRTASRPFCPDVF